MIPLDSITAFLEGITSAWSRAFLAYVMLSLSVFLTCCALGGTAPLLLVTWPLVLFFLCFSWEYLIPIPFIALIVIVYHAFIAMREGFDQKVVYVLIAGPPAIILPPYLYDCIDSRRLDWTFWPGALELIALALFTAWYWRNKNDAAE